MLKLKQTKEFKNIWSYENGKIPVFNETTKTFEPWSAANLSYLNDEDFFTPTAGQTDFVTSYSITGEIKEQVFINWNLATRWLDYNISGVSFEWIADELDENDRIIIKYYIPLSEDWTPVTKDWKKEIFIATNWQTQFTLAEETTDPESIRIEIEGLSCDCYSIIGKVVTLDTNMLWYDLEAGENVIFYYLKIV